MTVELSIQRVLGWIVPESVVVAAALLLPKYSRKLDPGELMKAMSTRLPPGTPKLQVIEFIRSRPALFCRDLGSKVEARLFGEAEDTVLKFY
jgi:hypothetical protein